ncbi:MAG TPA: Flp family type IVb pilin [Marmoricola sp.]
MNHVYSTLLMVRETLLARRDDKGASAVEYGLLVAGIAAVIVAAVFLLGGTINTMFGTVNTAIGG